MIFIGNSGKIRRLLGMANYSNRPSAADGQLHRLRRALPGGGVQRVTKVGGP